MEIHRFEVGKRYSASFGEWFLCTARTLVGVPNKYAVSFKSSCFPYEFTVKVLNNGQSEYFGGRKIVWATEEAESQSIFTEGKVLRCVSKLFPLTEENAMCINGILESIGYTLHKSDTSKRWMVKSDANKSYFNSEMFGEFGTIGDAFNHLKCMIEREEKSFNK